jgi:hypothetical protein
MLEAVLVLVTVAQRYRCTLSSRQPIRPQSYPTLRPEHGILMLLARREDPGGIPPTNPRSSEAWIYIAMIHRMSRYMLPVYH